MSRVTYEICNRCGKKLEGKLVKFEKVTAIYIFDIGPYKLDISRMNLDLCDECAAELKKFLSGGKVSEQSRTPQAGEKED